MNFRRETIRPAVGTRGDLLPKLLGRAYGLYLNACYEDADQRLGYPQ
jgi:hypothetical protein